MRVIKINISEKQKIRRNFINIKHKLLTVQMPVFTLIKENIKILIFIIS